MLMTLSATNGASTSPKRGVDGPSRRVSRRQVRAPTSCGIWRGAARGRAVEVVAHQNRQSDNQDLPLLRIKEVEQRITHFGSKLRQLVNPETGRLHPHYNVAGTKAGRWSANVQQLPHDQAMRSIIVA